MAITESEQMSDRLNRIAEDLKADRTVPAVSVREFLSWCGAQRRGVWIVESIRDELKKSGLETDPDFESAYIDASVEFALRGANGSSDSADMQGQARAGSETVPEPPAITSLASKDPTYRISKLASANKPVERLAPNDALGTAVTVLLANGFSQVPVMCGERAVKGIVTWESIGSALALKKFGTEARHFMISHREISINSSMFDAIPIIVAHGYVLIRNSSECISGILTASDLNLQFSKLSEPFLLLDEIENIVRSIIAAKCSKDDMEQAVNPIDGPRQVSGPADLTFGEYIRLLENNELWEKIDLKLDRKTFCDGMKNVCRIRNDVMHFDPDGITDEDLHTLRRFAAFMKNLRRIITADCA